MWLGGHMPIDRDIVNGLTGSLHSPWSYRWLNALTGSFVPLVVGNCLSVERSPQLCCNCSHLRRRRWVISRRISLRLEQYIFSHLRATRALVLLIALKAPKKALLVAYPSWNRFRCISSN
ncbi:MAG: hypothetical protein CLLPBCKN_000542 [Chroococcidiopsis cubana SAG 39.79]|nr:hypothetical protein [Chroococcidiopsis cubana SAG 39.79]